ncbi:MAG TPA: hypothetical protein DCX25_02525 [Candidatus Pacebacteria bacterium]|nr:MAG: hypothetical protein UX00_C0004G0072 [Microgenomates group bacterium GW2011_GWB1_45_17]KKU23930.1 MAG: hypothetical protein UX35_C0003G0066 [Microgenomates group bacterium GW2011_GWA1_46_15]KKU24677.1 MAG: hypothetical protein UX36_C0001G0294 [Microgenomates group bacterium GW2011_GWC1_46_15]HAV15179.1 hypothetical protein [Candidatus Paceibacterota bacterium]HCR11110.1 hypothetical protein [Candidatus Paceibacterota bacterium]
MPKKQTRPILANPGMMLVITYGALFAVNALVVYAANMFFPQYVVLGTATISLALAIVLSMGTLALIDTLAIPFIHEIEKLKKRMLTPMEWMIKYLILNFLGLAVITRFSYQFGLGVSSWYMIAALAIVLDLVQGIAMMELGERTKTKK